MTTADREAAQGLRVSRTVKSALWASWGDATGFISELTDERGLRRRLRNQPLVGPVAWPRRLGGKFGPTLTLPAGTYSDDTQLRLATCRSIGPAGFDVDAFARIELPVWLGYALGGGRASKAAAQAMSRANAVWYANDYAGWRDSGGNGAVMRVQPHAWAAVAPDEPGPWMADVIANAVCTHAHPRALIATALHCYSLGRALTTGQVPGPTNWAAVLGLAASVPELLHHRPELVDYWLPRYDEQARQAGEETFAQRWQQTVEEVSSQMRELAPLTRSLREAAQLASAGSSTVAPDVVASYEAIIALLQLRAPERRGSATGTTLAAMAVAWAMAARPEAAVLLACQALDTDTDTIATMVGALVGATAADRPPAQVREGQAASAIPTADAEYQTSQARRCAEIALGSDPGDSFTYPDLLSWEPPKTQLDVVAMDGEQRVLIGLSKAVPVADAVVDQRQQLWQWHVLDFGQHVLLKMRAKPLPADPGQLPARRQADSAVATTEQKHADPVTGGRAVEDRRPAASKNDRRREEQRRRNALAHLPGDADPEQVLPLEVEAPVPAASKPAASGDDVALPRDIEGILNWAENRQFDDRALAFFVRRLAEQLTLDQYLIATSLLRERLLAFEGRRPRQP